MKARELDPRRLDVAAFATEGASLQGEFALADLERLDGSRMAGDFVTPPVAWRAEGFAKPVLGGATEIWMDLEASTSLPLQCQRCLGGVTLPVSFGRRFRFVSGEERAAELDGEIDDEVLALTRALDLRELVEDELLMAMPLVPRHEDDCPAAPPLNYEVEEGAAEGGATPDAPQRENPFAALAALKTRKQQDPD